MDIITYYQNIQELDSCLEDCDGLTALACIGDPEIRKTCDKREDILATQSIDLYWAHHCWQCSAPTKDGQNYCSGSCAEAGKIY